MAEMPKNPDQIETLRYVLFYRGFFAAENRIPRPKIGAEAASVS